MEDQERLLNIYNNLLIPSLKMACLDFDMQCKVLPHFVNVPYEVIDGFEISYSLLAQLIDGGLLSEKVIADIIRVQYAWQIIVADDEFDNHDGDYYRTSKDWENLRNAAKVALDSMNVKLEEPYLGEGSIYIQ